MGKLKLVSDNKLMVSHKALVDLAKFSQSPSLPLGALMNLFFLICTRLLGRFFGCGNNVFCVISTLETWWHLYGNIQMAMSDLAHNQLHNGGNWWCNHQEEVVQPWSLTMGSSGIELYVLLV